MTVPVRHPPAAWRHGCALSLTATTIVLALSAATVPGAQGSTAGVQGASVAKAHAKTHRRSDRRSAKPTRCVPLTHRRGAHASGRPGAKRHRSIKCNLARPRPKKAPAPTSTPTVPGLLSPIGVPSIVGVTAAPTGPLPSRPTGIPSEPQESRFPPFEHKERKEEPGEKLKEEPGPKEKPKEGPKETKEPPTEEPPAEEPPKEKPPVESTGQLVGSAALQPDGDTTAGGEAEAFQYEALANGTVQSIWLYVNSGDTASSIVVGLYSNASGHPGTLLTHATIAAPVAGAWNSVDVPPVKVEQGATYWLAALAPKGTLSLRDLPGGGEPTQSSALKSLNSLPFTWTSGESYANSPASFYASGETTGPPPPPPGPTASFTYSPTAPEVGQSVKFNATASTCPAGSCTYEWSNDGGPVRPIPPLFPLGNGQTISLTFTAAGTEYVRLLVTDVLGQTATVEHNVTVAPVAKEEPKEKPKEEPKEEPKEKPKEEPKEKAKEEPKEEPPSKEEPSTQTNCIAKPSACGYPDATNTGVPAGTTLTPRSGEVSVTSAGTTVKDLAVTGEILVEANNTTLEDDEVIASAGSGNRGIYIAPGVTGTVIDHDTCHGEGSGSQYCVFNKDSSTKIEDSYLYNCGECLNGPGTITNSFFDVTAVISGEHYEDIYYGGGEGSLIVNHDTMLNPQGQTATVFASNDFGDQDTLTITNNLLAGGGYTLYGGASCTTGECGTVNGPVTVTGNRFSNKYYPESGYYGVGAYFKTAVTTWSGNFWDATLKSVPEPSE